MDSISIGIPVYGQLQYFKLAVDSIIKSVKNADLNYDLMIIDDNSCDKDLSDYLGVLSQDINIRILVNDIQKGVPYNWNKFLFNAKYDYLCIANSDIVAPLKSFKDIKYIFNNYTDIDILGNVSGRVPPAQIEDINVNKLNSVDFNVIDEIYEDINNKYNGFKIENIGVVCGFFFVMKKCLKDSVGYFDEIYGLGNSEEVDYCYRSIHFGKKISVARHIYIHHYGHASFKHDPKFMDLVYKNRNIQENKIKENNYKTIKVSNNLEW